MWKISTMQQNGEKIFNGRLTIGLDLGDRSSAYCVLKEVTESTVTSKGVIIVNYERAGALPTGSL